MHNVKCASQYIHNFSVYIYKFIIIIIITLTGLGSQSHGQLCLTKNTSIDTYGQVRVLFFDIFSAAQIIERKTDRPAAGSQRRGIHRSARRSSLFSGTINPYSRLRRTGTGRKTSPDGYHDSQLLCVTETSAIVVVVVVRCAHAHVQHVHPRRRVPVEQHATCRRRVAVSTTRGATADDARHTATRTSRGVISRPQPVTADRNAPNVVAARSIETPEAGP